jgi:hypothetical protein
MDDRKYDCYMTQCFMSWINPVFGDPLLRNYCYYFITLIIWNISRYYVCVNKWIYNVVA